MNRREKRVLNAFLNCIDSGEYSEDYAITLLEDNERYGYISVSAKDWFYEELDKRHPIIEETPMDETLMPEEEVAPLVGEETTTGTYTIY